MNQGKYYYLIYQQERGKLSAAEQAELTAWLAAKPEHQQMRKQVVEGLTAVDKYEPQFEVDVAKDYEQLQQKMGKEAPARPAIRRSLNRRRWMGVAAAIALLLVAAWNFRSQPQPEVEMASATTHAGEQRELILADGTSVWLNENSELSYPVQFAGDLRKVELRGEAFFEVQRNPEQPFVIQLPEASVEVLGTSFLIQAQSAEQTSVLVKTGKVRFANTAETAMLELVADQAAQLTHENQQMARTESVDWNHLAWKTKVLSFRNESLPEVFRTLEEHFRIEIDYDEAKWQNCRGSLTSQETNLKTIFSNLEEVFEVQIIEKTKDSYRVSGSGC